MSSDRDFSTELDNQSYEIQDELQIRKVLEQHTDWRFEFTKNDKHAYDIRITEWDEDAAGPDDNQVLGYVELERASDGSDWLTGAVPEEEWVYYSFLKRKVHQFNYKNEIWDGLKENYERTIYVKFNHAIDNCFAAAVTTIHQDGYETKYSDGSPENSYIALNLGHPGVHTGISDSMEFIEQYLSQYEPGQRALTDYGGNK